MKTLFKMAATVSALALIVQTGCSSIFPLGRKVDQSKQEKIDPALFNKEIFGEEVSKPINAGYLIYKGRYIPPPYVIKRDGLSLFINNVMVIGPEKWKNRTKKDFDAPPTPPDISMWCKSAIITEYIDETFKYYEALYKKPNPPQDKTLLKAIADHIKKAPNVKDAVPDEERQIIKISLYDLSNFNVSSSSVFGENAMQITEDSLRESYHRAFEKHVADFKSNKIVYRGIAISEIEWRETTKNFYDAVKILNSDSWQMTKRSKLGDLDFGSEKIIKDLVPVYQYSRELEKRLYDEYVKELDGLNKSEVVTPFDKFR